MSKAFNSKYVKYLKGRAWITQQLNHEAVIRTAPAKPGLVNIVDLIRLHKTNLKIYLKKNKKIKKYIYIIFINIFEINYILPKSLVNEGHKCLA